MSIVGDCGKRFVGDEGATVESFTDALHFKDEKEMTGSNDMLCKLTS